jgi:hypothetical protein
MHYTFDGRGDVLDNVLHQNVRIPEGIVTNILDSDHIPVMFRILNPVRPREAVSKTLQMSKFTPLMKLIN